MNLFFIRYVKTKGLAIIQDFAAHCAMKNEQMAQVWKFDSKSKLVEKTPMHNRLPICIQIFYN